MEVTPKQLIAACAAIFAGIVGINMIQQYREKGDLMQRLEALDLNQFKDKFVKPEHSIDPPEIDESSIPLPFMDEVPTEES